MTSGRHARDIELLDALDALPRVAVDDVVWRATRPGRDPLSGHPSGGRWDPGTFDVLYFSMAADGALSELHFHLSRQPVFPSQAAFSLHEVAVTTRSTLQFLDLSALEPLGVKGTEYPQLLYRRTQEIGDAAYFLGFDGIVAPSARFHCLNLVAFVDHLRPENLDLRQSTPIDWARWRAGTS